jgi:probable F420-dependent oxidoreductase
MGPVGLWWSTAYDTVPFSEERDALAEVDDRGWGAVWLPEAFGREIMAHAALALSATSRMAVVPGIANLWARDAVAMANGARTLAEAHPNRFAIGLGVSHRLTVERRGGPADYSPVEVVGRYLDAMDRAPYSAAKPGHEPLRLLAALGPRMLDLAAKRAAGAHTYTVPVEHTRIARETMGPGPFLAVEQKVVLTTDADRARAIGRAFLPLSLPNYRTNLMRCGFSSDELDHGGSDLLVDRLVAWGDIESIRSRVEAHLAAGADHVCLQVLPLDGGLPAAAWHDLDEALARAPFPPRTNGNP